MKTLINRSIGLRVALLILIAVAFCRTGYAQQKIKDKPNIIMDKLYELYPDLKKADEIKLELENY
jgi:hypothetical protein